MHGGPTPAVAADAASSAVIGVVVLWGPPTTYTVKGRHKEAGLCSPLRGGPMAAPLGEVNVGQEVDTAFETCVLALDGCS